MPASRLTPVEGVEWLHFQSGLQCDSGDPRHVNTIYVMAQSPGPTAGAINRRALYCASASAINPTGPF